MIGHSPKPANFENMMTCSSALEKIPGAQGKVTPCGYVLDAGINGATGAFVYTAPDQFFFAETAEDGKFVVTLPAGQKNDGEHKLYFEIKDKKLGKLSCDSADPVSDFQNISYKKSPFPHHAEYRNLYSFLLNVRINRMKETYDSHLKIVADRKKAGSREGDLQVDPYIDGLSSCTNLEKFGLPASSQLAQLPEKKPIPAAVLTHPLTTAKPRKAPRAQGQK